ncbi:uncharacterized protein EAE97_007652 [Botrytis byssoidea]|uniref:FAD dependent oxidoreductase domain-containing protein n=1 Tax=Botrytis byssoidea TaxID=139641 RepID=A0A9P5IFY3_9HELO|nr:uncharacterized protein EAE97_007652 [Botrytis byssoidea]KAF7937856.1 hypothetical protein EAE97_007652 [Botrytis byssoidea]
MGNIGQDAKNIVIIGGGIVGVSTAYWLTQHRLYDPSIHIITILEATEIAGGSSGKAGGLLASWATPSCLTPLSFKLHTELAEKYKGTLCWGYRRVHCADVTFDIRSNTSTNESIDRFETLKWINGSGIKEFSEIGKPDDTAQVHPKSLTRYLLDLAQAKGVRVIIAPATSINYSSNREAAHSVEYSEHGTKRQIHATDTIIAAGPWSSKLLPRIPVYGVRSHSILMKPSKTLSPYVLFPIFDLQISKESPEYKENDSMQWNDKETIIDNIAIYPRPGLPFDPEEIVYICGPSDYSPLPESTDKVLVDPSMIAGIRNAASTVSPEIENGEFVLGQACFRPQIQKHADGEAVGPIVGGVPGITGLWIATGHDEWGVQNSQGTGKILAGMVMRDELEGVDVKALDPRNFFG